MNVFKFILPLCLLLPSSVIISQKVEAQAQCTVYANGTECIRPPQLESACIATAKFNICQAYHRMWCQDGRSMGLGENMRYISCSYFNLSRSNPGYYQQIISANKFCTSGNQQACNWIKQQRLP
jgi:hypothetical protein